MLPKKLAFVDIETTGGRSFYDRIIEIGILRVEDNQVVQTYRSLVNPNTYLPKEITMLTGITAGDLEDAPTFREVKQEISELLRDCIFVAHNVRFDYSFVKNEFQRHNETFSAKQLCTVKLSRLLYPAWRHHNLDSVIEHCNFTCDNRHRAFDDAKILLQFYQHVQNIFTLEAVETAINTCMKKPSLPIRLSAEILDNLPERPGIYIFYGAQDTSENPACRQARSENSAKPDIQNLRISDNQIHRHTEFSEFSEIESTRLSNTLLPLYVGKSKNIRERVLSHFAADIRSGIEMRISQQVEHIETIPTAGELGALLLESQLIKKMLPLYNRRSRLKREMVAIKSRLTKAGYQEAYLEPVSTIRLQDYSSSESLENRPHPHPLLKGEGTNKKARDTHDTLATPACPSEFSIGERSGGTLQSFLGFFKSRRQAKSELAELAKRHHLCEKLLGLEKGNGACFAYRLEHCKGACTGLEKPVMYNLRFLTAFANLRIKTWPFQGPIVIEEGPLEENKEYFLIDQWCYIGNIIVDEYGNQQEKLLDEVTFDLDIYQIIRQFLRQPGNLKKVKNYVQNQEARSKD